jgi:hypothetical protein
LSWARFGHPVSTLVPGLGLAGVVGGALSIALAAESLTRLDHRKRTSFHPFRSGSQVPGGILGTPSEVRVAEARPSGAAVIARVKQGLPNQQRRGVNMKVASKGCIRLDPCLKVRPETSTASYTTQWDTIRWCPRQGLRRRPENHILPQSTHVSRGMRASLVT